MSLFQSFNVGVTGLQAQSNVLGIISDNLSNINTVGYKKTSALFQNLVANDYAAAYSPGGVQPGFRALNDYQGPISRTERATDIAISGNGFFTVRDEATASSNIFYTRSGSFAPDKDGNFRNGAGFFLQGWLLTNQQLDASLSGNAVTSGAAISAMQTVNVQNLSQIPVPTSLVSIFANLRSTQAPLANSSVTLAANLNAATLSPATANISMVANLNSAQAIFSPSSGYDANVSGLNMASGAIVPHFSRTVTAYDNTGAPRTIQIGMLKTAADTWAVEMYTQPASDVTQTDGQLASGTLTFNADGTLATVSAGLSSPITAAWNNVGGSTTLAFNPGAIDTNDGVSQGSSGYSGYLQSSPAYDPASNTLSMASGGVAANYTTNLTVVDNTGATRTLTVGFLKTGPDAWAVEVYAQPLTDVTTQPGFATGQVAYGTATFNSNGSLASISPLLENPIQVGWNGAPASNTVSVNWRAVGASAGLSQNAAIFSSSASTVRNYDPTSATLNMAEAGVAPHFSREVNIIDSQGELHTISVGFLKTGINTWSVEIYAPTATEIGSTSPLIASGTLTFNGDGSLASASSSLISPIAIAWADPAGATTSATFNFGTVDTVDGVSQQDKAYSARINQNGFQSTALQAVEITTDGFIVGIYENGGQQRLYKIPLAHFNEPNKLESVSGNIFAETFNSGVGFFSGPGQGAVGELVGSALENSNVETEAELVNMIIAQRSYQANSKTVSTTDEMLQALTQIL